MDNWNSNLPNLSETFDQDYKTQSVDLIPDHNHSIDVNNFSHYNGELHESFHYNDPLKYCYKHQFKPLHLDTNLDSGVHFVKPHQVDSYIRADGTLVEGYFRDGDGDTSINRSVEQGGGYLRRD